jgi:phosphohistidine swiveling domain-containing protein
MESVRRFEEIRKRELALAGGKGASLVRMTQAGLPVPPGYIVLSTAFDEFINRAGLRVQIRDLLESIRRGDGKAVRIAHKIQNTIHCTPIPRDIRRDIHHHFQSLGSHHVAVRSSANVEDSATSAWAGQFETYLNTTRSTLLRNIKRCWAAAFSSHVILYWQAKRTQQKAVTMAVIVQSMVRSEVSGISFSTNFQEANNNEIVIEAAPGLGDKIVRGQVSPDRWVVNKRFHKLIPVSPAPHGLMGDSAVRKLAKLVSRAEKLFCFPVDVEWAYARKKLFLLQARPISVQRQSVRPSPRWRPYASTLKVKLPQPTSLSSDAAYFLNFKGSHIPLFYAELLRKAHDPFRVVLAHSRTLDNTYWEYIPRHELRRARRAAARLFLSHHAFKRYAQRLSSTFSKGERGLRRIASEPVTKLRVQAFLRWTDAIFRNYTKMDAFYTDLMYSEFGTSLRFKRTLNTYEKLKENYRAKLNALFFQKGAFAATIMEKIAVRHSVMRSEIWWYKPDELITLFSTGPISSDLIRRRQQAYLLTGSFQKPRTYFGGSALSRIRKLVQAPQAEVVRGDVASIGNGRILIGRVRNVQVDFSRIDRAQLQLRRMRRNDILVISATGPEVLEAMYKASAIITDAGGLLSHAAITSRELGIPCIVNTRFGTTLLKTGDRVEIDPYQGTVKKLRGSP